MARQDLSSGSLRHRLCLQSPPTAAGSRGQVTGDFTNDAILRGSVEPLTGRELERANQIAPLATLRVVIRYRDDVTTANRFLFGTKELNIEHVLNPDERNRKLICLCKEGG